MAVLSKDLWSLVLDHQWVDPAELAEAVEEQAAQGDLDFRTRLLIRDSVAGLRHHWGEKRVTDWLRRSPAEQNIDQICREDFSGEFGFPYLKGQIMEPTRPETVRQYFEELGQHFLRREVLHVGGSISLIMKGLLSRRTSDVDVVNEVPNQMRSEPQFLNGLAQRYGLSLTHFQERYLPMGWRNRIHSLDMFGDVLVYLVDPYDVVLSKIYSGREKDRDDLRAVVPLLDKEILLRKLKETTQSMLAAPDLRTKAENNWKILFGEPLPV